MNKISWDDYLCVDRERKSASRVGKPLTDGVMDSRNEFDSDFGRVIFSTAIRRMHDKTQVFPLTSGDYYHTRLTHSIEVMNLAQSLAINFCRSKEFVDLYGEDSYELERRITSVLRTSALIHDIGNPPFGHYGENTIQKYFLSKGFEYLDGLSEEQKRDFTEYDGNAQGLRTVTKTQYHGDLYGLNLTYGTLAVYMKYPNIGPRDKNGYVGSHKHGVFDSEKDIFERIVDKCGLKRKNGTIKRHPLAFIVEAADTICYRVMDIEDGILSGKFSLEQVLNFVSAKVLNNGDPVSFSNWMFDISNKFSFEKFLKLKYEPYWQKRVVNFRVALINYFSDLVITNYITHFDEIEIGNYSKELVEDDPYNISNYLKEFQTLNLFNAKEIVSAELKGAAVIEGLLDLLLPIVINYDNYTYKDQHVFHLISESELKLIHQENGLFMGDNRFSNRFEKIPRYYRLRYLVDWISGMTDKYAFDTFQKLKGIR